MTFDWIACEECGQEARVRMRRLEPSEAGMGRSMSDLTVDRLPRGWVRSFHVVCEAFWCSQRCADEWREEHGCLTDAERNPGINGGE